MVSESIKITIKLNFRKSQIANGKISRKHKTRSQRVYRKTTHVFCGHSTFKLKWKGKPLTKRTGLFQSFERKQSSLHGPHQ